MRLHFCWITAIVAINVFRVNAISPSVLSIQQRAEGALQQRMDRLSPKLRSDASSCYAQFSKLLKDLLETYATRLQQCNDIESESILAVSNEDQLSRDDITKSLNTICAGFGECKALILNLQFFDCVDRSGEKSTRDMWKAFKNASESAASIRKKIHDIQYQTGRCVSEAEYEYIVKTAQTTKDMMACYAEVEEKDQVEELEMRLKNRNEF